MIAHGISKGDTVDLIRAEQTNERDANRAEDAVEGVKSTLEGAVGEVTVNVTTLSDLTFGAVVTACSEIITAANPPIVCLGSGASELHLPMTVATTAHQEYIKSTMAYGDIQATATEITIPPLANDLPGRARDTFRTLGGHDDDRLPLATLAQMCDHSRSTASRHAKTLEDHGYVRTTTEKKSKLVELTPFGKLKYRSLRTDKPAPPSEH